MLLQTRPTAVNLKWALEAMQAELIPLPPERRAAAAAVRAGKLCDDDVATNAAIGAHGVALLQALAARRPGARLNVLTHCNAGWLACVDHGTALAPIYLAHDQGMPVHVWVEETRPRNQGASLTAWELAAHGVPHTLIVDNAGGHLMQRGEVDCILVGSDRTTAAGDVANKIGTYLKALAAKDCGVPFYVALPSSTIDWALDDGLTQIAIEERAEAEVLTVQGQSPQGTLTQLRVAPAGTRARNPGFDVTPARLVTALVTERGVCAASRDGLRALFPERGQHQPRHDSPSPQN
jgi:methylthioribose-1-phosphate isomerase